MKGSTWLVSELTTLSAGIGSQLLIESGLYEGLTEANAGKKVQNHYERQRHKCKTWMVQLETTGGGLRPAEQSVEEYRENLWGECFPQPSNRDLN